MLPIDILLIPAGPEDYRDLAAPLWRGYRVPEGGLAPAPVMEILIGWSARLLAAQGWGSWIAVAGGEVVASVAVKHPLAAGTVEIGYGVAPAAEGRGVATAAVLALVPLLQAKGARQITAESSPDNPASGRVLTKAGFMQTGRRDDPEDGALIQWQLAL